MIKLSIASGVRWSGHLRMQLLLDFSVHYSRYLMMLATVVLSHITSHHIQGRLEISGRTELLGLFSAIQH